MAHLLTLWNSSMGSRKDRALDLFAFKLYTRPLTNIARKHNISVHLYADDTQLYVSFPPHDSAQAMTQLERCIEEIRQWMISHNLKLNDSKTEFLILGAPKDL